MRVYIDRVRLEQLLPCCPVTDQVIDLGYQAAVVSFNEQTTDEQRYCPRCRKALT